MAYHKIGTPFTDRPSIFQLDISDFLIAIDPARYDIDTKGIDPAMYFISSGDAVEKAKYLLRQYKEHRATIAQLKRTKKVVSYLSKIDQAIISSKKLLKYLLEARGPDCFLETEWENHVLKCVPKNPKIKKPKNDD